MLYKNFIKKLKIICLKKGIRIEKIGSVVANRAFPLFKVVADNKLRSYLTVCFSAGIHGEEPAGPWAILEFLKKFNPRKYPRIKVIFFPIASPYGFDRCQRRNFLRKDLNGHFCHKRLSGENRILHNAVKYEKIFFFHALHEDKGLKSFYLYNFEHKEEKIYRDIIKLAATFFPINRHRFIYGDASEQGIIKNRKDGLFEDRLFRDGVPYSMCTETPEARKFRERVKLNVGIMDLVLNFSQNFLNKNKVEILKGLQYHNLEGEAAYLRFWRGRAA